MGSKFHLPEKDRNGLHVWRLRVYVNGKQHSETFKYKGQETGAKAAQRALEDFERRVRQPQFEHSNRTVRDLWDAWEADMGRLSPNTARDYRSIARFTILPELGSIKLADLKAQRLNAFYRKHEERGAAPRTVMKYHRLLSVMLREAERWDWITLSPARNARAPKVRRPEVHTPSLEMVRKLVDAADSERLKLLILLAASLGARRGELVGLKWEDVRGGVVSISRSAYEVVGGGVDVKPTKTDQPRRVSIDPQAYNALERLREGRLGYIFSDDGVNPWRPDHATKLFRRVRAKVTKEPIRLHDLRHAHATHLIAAGVDFVTVSKRLGHAKVSTTLDIYSHALEQRDQEAANLMGQLLRPDDP